MGDFPADCSHVHRVKGKCVKCGHSRENVSGPVLSRLKARPDDYEKALAAILKKAKADSKTVQTEYEHSQLSVRIASYAVALEMYRRYKKNGFLELAK